MRIGINALFLLPGQVGGSEIYTRSLIAALGRVDHENEYLLFVGEHNRGIFSDLPYQNFHEKLIVTRWSAWLPSVFQRGLEQLRLLDSVVGKQLTTSTVDFIHFPGTTIDPLSLSLPCIVNVHDIQQEFFPDFFSLRERIRRKRFYQASTQKAEFVIATSEFTRQTLIEKYKLPPDKVKTIYGGVTTGFCEPVPEQIVQQVKQKYNLPEKFAVFPGKPWPHKNHQRLFEAMRLLKSRYQSDCHLVLCGFSANELPPALSELQDTVRVLGYIPEQDLRAIYRLATLMVFPSLFEGFGLPVLEAMASGCPVVCSNVTALPEIAGEAALLVDPLNIEAIAQAMQRILMDTELRVTLSERGRARARLFSWEATAQATIEVYRETYDKLLD